MCASRPSCRVRAAVTAMFSLPNRSGAQANKQPRTALPPPPVTRATPTAPGGPDATP
ncbi:hypothetical protein GCM10010335_07970 [Streptomyces galbus]|nr:hypothetical protein GCM10010335_07970 [Streptomyces galbus]